MTFWYPWSSSGISSYEGTFSDVFSDTFTDYPTLLKWNSVFSLWRDCCFLSKLLTLNEPFWNSRVFVWFLHVYISYGVPFPLSTFNSFLFRLSEIFINFIFWLRHGTTKRFSSLILSADWFLISDSFLKTGPDYNSIVFELSDDVKLVFYIFFANGSTLKFIFLWWFWPISILYCSFIFDFVIISYGFIIFPIFEDLSVSISEKSSFGRIKCGTGIFLLNIINKNQFFIYFL